MTAKSDALLTDAINAVVSQITQTLFVLQELDPRTLQIERRMQYSAAYGLICIGDVIERHSRQLEPAYPDYGWAWWVDLRNTLAHHPGRTSVDELAQAVTEHAPDLVRTLTGAEPDLTPRVNIEDLPLDDIADFCRQWGIKEMYMTPPELTGLYMSGPFEGIELAMLVDYHDDAPGRKRHFSMGPYLSQLIGIKTHVRGLPDPHGKREHYFQDEMMAQRELVYVE